MGFGYAEHAWDGYFCRVTSRSRSCSQSLPCSVMGIVVVAVDRAPESWVKRIRTKVDERCQKVPWPIGEQPLKAAARASIAEKHLHVDSIECLAKSLQSVYRGFRPGEGGNSTSFGLVLRYCPSPFYRIGTYKPSRKIIVNRALRPNSPDISSSPPRALLGSPDPSPDLANNAMPLGR
ncbi:hypothetical protein NEUTE2DRAFT_54134 [Neurospora tetrasperma FGSC 2509]|nr:hypothetical protein NEUTE2DRAFT_54134 [Neurospora tetrasperma FGSC 2509]